MREKKHKIILKQLGLSVPVFLLCGTPGKAATDSNSLFTPPPADISSPHKPVPSVAYAQRQVPAENPGAAVAAYAPSAQRHIPAENPDAPALKQPPAQAQAVIAQAPKKQLQTQTVAVKEPVKQPAVQHNTVTTGEIRTSFHGALPPAFMQSFLASGNMPPNYLKKNHDIPTAEKLANYSQYSAAMAKPTPAKGITHVATVTQTAYAATSQPNPENYVQIGQDVAPVLHRPVSNGSTPTSVVVIHHAAQVADNRPAAHATTAMAATTAPVAQTIAIASTPTQQPVPASPNSPAIVKTEVALRAPDPVDRKQLQFGRTANGTTPISDVAKTTHMPTQTVASGAGVTPQECIILPWQLPKPPETIVATDGAPQEVATKIITLDQHNVEVAMAPPDSNSAPAPLPGQPANAPLPFIPPDNPPPLTIPPQNPADVKAQSNGLSPQDKKIIDSIPPEVEKHSARPDPIHMQHEKPNAMEGEDQVKKHNGIGIQISVKQPKFDVNKLLDNAYNALIAGDQEQAIQSYRQVLDTQPSNKLALFGLATTYHRAGLLPEARMLYGKLLSVDPYNFEGLNNYLVLLSDENPEEAIAELGKLEKTHPGFSPIPAQQAIIYEKTGDYTHAAEKMSTAIALSPENLKYRYNMAIILDKKGDWSSAAGYYQDLINANDRGEKIAANPEEIQQRLTFILSNKPHG